MPDKSVLSLIFLRVKLSADLCPTLKQVSLRSPELCFSMNDEKSKPLGKDNAHTCVCS